MLKNLKKVYAIIAWPGNGELPWIMWATPTHELAVKDIEKYLNEDDDITYSIREIDLYGCLAQYELLD